MKKIIAQAEPAKLQDAELEVVAGGRFKDKETAAKTSSPTVCCW